MDPNDVPAEEENDHVAMRHQTWIYFSGPDHLASPVPPPRLPKEKKDVRPDSSIIGECTVCYNTVPTTKRTCCGTSVCNDCMDEYLTGCINKGVYKISCIGCDVIMPHDEVKPKLTRNARTLARTRLSYLRVHHGEDPNRKACPFCKVISNFEGGLKNYFEKYESIVVCPECEKEWCYSCEVPWHSGLTCGEFHASKVNTKVESWADERILGGQRNAIKCPECGVYIQRIEGCYMMSCSQCKTKCCYDCGDRVPHPNTSKCGRVGGAHDPRPATPQTTPPQAAPPQAAPPQAARPQPTLRPATAPPVARVARVPTYIVQPKPRRQYCKCLKTYRAPILVLVISFLISFGITSAVIFA